MNENDSATLSNSHKIEIIDNKSEDIEDEKIETLSDFAFDGEDADEEISLLADRKLKFE